MSLSENRRLLLPLLLVTALSSQNGLAQTGKGSGMGNSSTNTTRSTTSAPISVPRSDNDFNRNIILTGNVVTMEGTPPPEPVAIERICGARRVRMGYTDSKGYFSLQLAQPPVMQDASEDGRGAYSWSAVRASNTGGWAGGSSTAANNLRTMLMGCELTGVLSGFQSSWVMIRVEDPIQATQVGTIVLLRAERQGSTVSATSLRAPKDAKKAYDKASADLRKQKPDEAQAELQKAVKLYPQYAAAWNDLGWLYARHNQLNEAREAFAQAHTADEGFVPPYVGLAALATRESKWGEALEFSSRATKLDGVDFPSAHYYSALASYQLGQIDNAEKSARKAERLDPQHALPQINLLLGTILAQRQDYAEGAKEFKFYLKLAPDAANAERVRQQVTELETLAASASSSPAQKR